MAATTKSRHHRLPIGHQVMLGAGGLVAIVAASILVGLILVVNLREDGQRVNVRDVPYATAVATAALNAKGAANDERGFLLTGDSDFINEAHARIDSARSAFAAAKSAATDTARRQVVTEASAGFERCAQALNEEITTFKSGDRRSPIADSPGFARETRKAYERSLDKAQALGASAVDSDGGSFEAASARSVKFLLAWLLLAVGIGCGLAVWLTRWVALPLYRLVAILAPTNSAQ